MSSLSFYEPFFSLNDFQRFFDDVFDRTSSERQVVPRNGQQQQRTMSRGFQPRVDIHEAPEANVVTVWFELPGMTKENISIDVSKGRLVVSGEAGYRDVDEKGFIHRERRTGRFERTLPLPTGTQPSDIKASLENGLLTVTFPKSSPEQLPQRVTIS
ncbi:small heat shock protein [Fomitiporia mediterranea MF3/22]|uniref:small heat shock protein n=1 Tax=Fomitiporia mediterranea (strain MF3/22) TaxID=694068 RepID=UPI000440971F|nr:small heat shock protein [Fomitiporia mediterranea MF3/22]EJC97803.1 small heat shock protein [Fomitiporia mediterranea MF3/22]